MTRALAECSQNQSKLQNLGSRSPSVRRTNQNSRNSVRVRFTCFRFEQDQMKVTLRVSKQLQIITFLQTFEFLQNC